MGQSWTLLSPIKAATSFAVLAKIVLLLGAVKYAYGLPPRGAGEPHCQPAQGLPRLSWSQSRLAAEGGDA